MRAGLAATGLRTRRLVKREKLQWAREMRLNPTAGEAELWERLRMGRLGFKFRRQALVRGYIVDFWCPKVKLVVEVDGGYHRSPQQQEWDAKRDQVLRDLGILTLRVQDEDVLRDQQEVCTRVFSTACRLLRTQNESKNASRRASREAAGTKARVAPSAPQPG